jgi:hypothetical protein
MGQRVDEQVAQRVRDGITEALSAALRELPQGGEEVHMRLLAAAEVGTKHAQELLREAVAAARHAGCSWAAIGEQLGVTKQAAQQRYGPAGEPTPGRRQRLLKPVTALTEMKELAAAGAHGWHSVSYGWMYHLLEESDQQWEHHRDFFPVPGNRKRLEARGWVHIGTTFPWQYFKRPLRTPALPEVS